MPIYVYEAKSGGCPKCKESFEIAQSIHDAKLETCPDCGAPVRRVIQAPALGRSSFDLDYRAKRAGFKKLKKVQTGEYEKMY